VKGLAVWPGATPGAGGRLTALAPAIVLAATLPACAGPAAPGATFGPDHLMRSGCGMTDPPPLEEALDAGPVRAWLGEHAAADMDAPAVVVLSVRRQSPETESADPWVRPMETGLDPEATDRLVAVVVEGLPSLEEGAAARERPPRPAFRLLLKGGRDPTVEVGPAVECPPRVRNRPTIDRALHNLADEVGGPYRAVVQVEVAPDGSAGQVELVESSGNALADQGFLGVARRMRFDPAHLDGFPVTTHSRLPLSVGG